MLINIFDLTFINSLLHNNIDIIMINTIFEIFQQELRILSIILIHEILMERFFNSINKIMIIKIKVVIHYY